MFCTPQCSPGKHPRRNRTALQKRKQKTPRDAQVPAKGHSPKMAPRKLPHNSRTPQPVPAKGTVVESDWPH